MANIIQVTLFFSNKPLTRVWTTGGKINIEEQYRHLLPEKYMAEDNGKEKVITRRDPISYLTFLYQGISGDYLRASKSEVIEI